MKGSVMIIIADCLMLMLLLFVPVLLLCDLSAAAKAFAEQPDRMIVSSILLGFSLLIGLPLYLISIRKEINKMKKAGTESDENLFYDDEDFELIEYEYHKNRLLEENELNDNESKYPRLRRVLNRLMINMGLHDELMALDEKCNDKALVTKDEAKNERSENDTRKQ